EGAIPHDSDALPQRADLERDEHLRRPRSRCDGASHEHHVGRGLREGALGLVAVARLSRIAVRLARRLHWNLLGCERKAFLGDVVRRLDQRHEQWAHLLVREEQRLESERRLVVYLGLAHTPTPEQPLFLLSSPNEEQASLPAGAGLARDRIRRTYQQSAYGMP